MRPGPLLLWAAFGICLGGGSYTFFYAQGISYMSNDPKACVNCHIMREQYDGWLKGSHHNVATCNDCHTPQDFFGKYWTKAENGFHHSKGFTLQNFHEPIQIRPKNSVVLENNCIRCHGDLASEIAAHPAPAGGRLDCVKCHDRVGHGARR